MEFVHNNEPRLGLVTKVDKMSKSADVQLMNKEEDGWTEEEECVAFDEIVRLFQHECVKCSAYLCGECEMPIFDLYFFHWLLSNAFIVNQISLAVVTVMNHIV